MKKWKIISLLPIASMASALSPIMVTTTSCGSGIDESWFGELPDVHGLPGDPYQEPNISSLKQIKNEDVIVHCEEWAGPFTDEACTIEVPDEQKGIIPEAPENSDLYYYYRIKLSLKDNSNPFTAGASTIIKKQKIHITTTQAVNFETDDWSTVIYHANQGFEHLKQAYNVPSFVGMKKTCVCEIPGLEGSKSWDYQVIGENHDSISFEDNKKAALTFQSVGGMYKKASWYYRNFVSDWRKYLDSWLQSDTGILIQKNAKMVDKGIYCDQSGAVYSDDYKVVTYHLYTFIPSQSEIFGDGPAEGAQYTFYKNAANRVKKNPDGEACEWWTRTPVPSVAYMDPVDGVYIGTDGSRKTTGLFKSFYPWGTLCFCI